MNEIIHLKSKTSTKVFENESKEIKSKPSFDLTSDPVTLEPSCLDYLENLAMSTIGKNILISIAQKNV